MTQTAIERSAGADFENLPYISHPFSVTQPASLATIAALQGFVAPDPKTARVLELGCAAGGNIIPLAARYPDATFLGLDLSQTHVDIAQSRISQLGLENVDIRTADLGNPDAVSGAWDYIICHGVFSWVDADVQAQILKTCSAHLADNGLAYISYNVLPGWQLRKVVRDIFMFDDNPDSSAKERVARGRWLLEQLAEGTDENATYGRLLRAEAAQLAKQTDNYIMAEFLAEENEPCYFHDFIARANDVGLSFLSEAKASSLGFAKTNAKRDEKIRTLAGPNRDKYEQYQDFLTGRQFRQTVLYKESTNPDFRISTDKAPFTSMNFIAKLSVANHPERAGHFQVTSPKGPGFTTNDPAVAAMVRVLDAAYPASRSPRQILESLSSIDGLDRTNLSDRIIAALQTTTFVGLATPSVEPTVLGTGQEDRPKLWSVATCELAQGQTWVTNQLHAPIGLDPATRRLVPLLDGQRDKQAIQVEASEILVAEADALGLLHVDTKSPKAVAAFVDTLITQVAKLGLLQA